MKHNNVYNLENSFKYIFKITVPLIVVSLSSYLMLAIDRIVLATVSADMMNAVSISGNFIPIFSFFFLEIIEKNTIFISQFYGDKQNKKISSCVWQMIFLSILTIPFMFMISFFSNKLNILPHNLIQYGIPYQKIILSFSFISFIYTALTTFFIGQGNTYIISISVLIGCLINLFFSIFFVKFLNLGTIGSAYGTVIGQFIQLLFLTIIFFNKNNKNTFKTHKISWDFSLFKKILKLGTPVGFLTSGSMLIWFIIIRLISNISKEQLTLYNLLTIVNLFLVFISDALMQAVSTISANLIAKKDLKGIKILIKRFFIIILTTFGILAFFILFFKKSIINMIFNIDPELKNSTFLVHFCFYSVMIFGALKCLYTLLQGVCFAGGDTKFVSIVNTTLIIFLDFLPICLLKYFGLLTSIFPIIFIFLIEPVPFMILYFWRYKSLKWYKKII